MTELAFNLWRWFGLHGVLIWLANINTLVKRKFGFNKKLFPCTVLFDSYNNSVSNHPILPKLHVLASVRKAVRNESNDSPTCTR